MIQQSYLNISNESQSQSIIDDNQEMANVIMMTFSYIFNFFPAVQAHHWNFEMEMTLMS
jgi:hypothetical protein